MQQVGAQKMQGWCQPSESL